MDLTRYAFIVKALGYEPETHRHVLESPAFRADVVGVETEQQTIGACRELIDAGVQVIELCGGFSAEEAEHIVAALDCDVPIGHVTFSAGEERKLNRFLLADSQD